MRGLPPNPERDAPDTEAVRWLVRIQSDAATADDWVALTRWLEASEENVRAFARAELVSQAIADNAPEIARAVTASPPASGPFGATLVAPRAGLRPAWRWLAGLAAVATIALVVAAPTLRRVYEGAPMAYRTAAGETRLVTLADGTRIRLDGASLMTVRLGWRARRVELANAQASFDVTRDPSRPFLVDVADQRVRVVGTEFNIRDSSGLVVVTVRRGVVEVSQPNIGAAPVARLAAGDALRHTQGSTQSIRQKVDADRAFAWSSGRLVFDDEPLSQVVAELNRHYPTPIRVTPAAGAKRFSGVLVLGDQSILIHRLAQYLSLSVQRSEREIALS